MSGLFQRPETSKGHHTSVIKPSWTHPQRLNVDLVLIFPCTGSMSTVATLGDDQWHRLLDFMNSRQETFPMQQQQQQQPAARQAPLRQSDAHPANAGDQGFAELNAMNFNPPVNGTFDSEPDFATFAAPQAPLRQINLDDISMIELQRIAKELEGVKQR